MTCILKGLSFSHVQAFEERIARLVTDNTRLQGDLQTEQDTARRADAGRRQLETELRDVNQRLTAATNATEDAEKDTRRQVNALDAKNRELEMTLEAEAKRGREITAQLR